MKQMHCPDNGRVRHLPTPRIGWTVLALALVAGCAEVPPDQARCIDTVGSGQHGRRMIQVPCEPPAVEPGRP